MTKNSPNLELFNSIIKEDCENIKEYLSGNCFDFNGFSDFIASNNLSGYLYTAICRLQLSNYFPPDLIKRFKLSYIKQWSKNEKFLREIRALNDIFVKAGRNVLFLKGPFLAQRFYGNIDRRSISDIDILAGNTEDFQALDSLLAQNGYKRQSMYFISKNLTYCFAHHFEYKKQDINLDLHWVLQRHFSFNIDNEKIWAGRQKVSAGGMDLFTLSDEYTLIAIMLSIIMDIQSGDAKLKSFLDIYAILKSINKSTDWKVFFENRKEEGLFLISLAVFNITLDLFDCCNDFKELNIYIKHENPYPDLFDSSRYSMGAFKRKFWAFKLYDASVCKSFFWWITSGFFRVMVCRNANRF